jgi:hypothetical protein
MLFSLTYNGNDIKCLKCNTELRVEWYTEYGDPLIGCHTGKCPKCGSDVDFECYIQYTQD